MAMPLEPCDHGRGTCAQRRDSLADVMVCLEVVDGTGEARQVVAGGEGFGARSPQDDSRGALTVNAQGFGQRREQLWVERIAAVGPIDRQGEDVVSSPLTQQGFSHGRREKS